MTIVGGAGLKTESVRVRAQAIANRMRSRIIGDKYMLL
jgi:hypothetical protein